ncbi:MAG: hypothetical protein IPM74_13650 [Crocinitomicaceae bacterium]|nr:hypothetical protein [Crocinitomicaceae bacterium]MBK8926919.1 hypothetical protein [Crocinitomicaceae bacterium]
MNRAYQNIDEGRAIYKPLKKFEKLDFYFLAALLLLILLGTFNIRIAGMFMLVFCGMLSLLYFFTSMLKPEQSEHEKFASFITKLGGMASAISLVGIQFEYMSWEMADRILIGGGLALLVWLIFRLMFRTTNTNFQQWMNRVSLRAILLIGLTAMYYFVPDETLIEAGLKKEKVERENF